MSREDLVYRTTSVSYSRPRSSIQSKGLMNSLRTRLVPAVLQECQVVSVRCVWDFVSRDRAVEQLAARRRQLEMKLLELDEVRSHFFIYYSFVSRKYITIR